MYIDTGEKDLLLHQKEGDIEEPFIKSRLMTCWLLRLTPFDLAANSLLRLFTKSVGSELQIRGRVRFRSSIMPQSWGMSAQGGGARTQTGKSWR